METQRNFPVASILIVALFFFISSFNILPLNKERVSNAEPFTGSKSFALTSPEASEIILESIAAKEDIPIDRLHLINEHRREYPELARTFWCIKAMDEKTHRIYDGMIDT